MTEFSGSHEPMTPEILDQVRYSEAYLALSNFRKRPETEDDVQPEDLWVLARHMGVVIDASAEEGDEAISFLRKERANGSRPQQELIAVYREDGGDMSISMDVIDPELSQGAPIRSIDIHLSQQNQLTKTHATDLVSLDPWTTRSYYAFDHPSYRSGPEPGERRRFLEITKQFCTELLDSVQAPSSEAETYVPYVPDNMPQDWLDETTE
jgi:hypothetical protein